LTADDAAGYSGTPPQDTEGAGGAPSTGGSGGAGGGVAPSGDEKDGDGCGCRVAASPSRGAGAGVLLALAALGWLGRRRGARRAEGAREQAPQGDMPGPGR